MLATNALTTLEEVKKYLGIDVTDDSQDESLHFLINSASSLIEKYCERVFGLKLHQEFLPGRDTTRLIVQHYPIVALHTLTILDQPIQIDSVRVLSEKGMLYRADGGFASSRQAGRFMRPRPDSLYDSVYVEYEAGYVLPKDGTEEVPRTLPFDLELACLKTVAHMKRDRDIQQGNGKLIMKSESIGDWSASYEQEVKTDAKTSTSFISTDVETILNEYARSEFEV